MGLYIDIFKKGLEIGCLVLGLYILAMAAWSATISDNLETIVTVQTCEGRDE